MLKRKPTRSVKLNHGTSPVDVRRFDEVLSLIAAARQRAYQAVNAELVALYWKLGGYISQKIASAEWGDGVADELAATIAREYPGQRGFTRANLFRMRRFFDAYHGQKKVAPLVRQLHPAAVLQRKLHELYAELASQSGE